MPGLNQLKKFAQDINVLGNEAQRRMEKEETMPVIEFPNDISEADDSDEFLFGLPEQKKDADANDETDEDSLSTDNSIEELSDDDIDIDSILEQAANEANNISFTNTEENLDNEEDLSSSLDFSIPGLDEDFDFSALDSFEAQDSQESLDIISNNTDSQDNFLEETNPEETDFGSSNLEPLDSSNDFSFDENLDELSSDEMEMDFTPEEIREVSTSYEDPKLLKEESGEVYNFDSEGELDSLEEIDFSMPDLEGGFESVGKMNIEDSTKNQDNGDSFDLPEDTEFIANNPIDTDSNELPDFDFPANSENMEELGNNEEIDFSVPEFDSSALDFDSSAMEMQPLDSMEQDLDFSMPETENPLESQETDLNFDNSFLGEMDFSTPDFDASNFDSSSLSSLENVDFENSNDDFENVENSSEGFDEFSDFDLVPPEVPQEVKKRSLPFNTGKGKKEEILTTELTEDEYKVFLQNLNYYPLNLRVAIEEMIVGNEFNDDVVMEVVRKIIKKVPARHLAGHVEKLMDRSIPVPANYEKRTVAEYEAYQKSFEYKLKNKILPFALVSIISLGFCILLGFLTAKFVVTPVKANILYKEGYALLENGMYPLSEIKFNEASNYKSLKRWHFKYARGYAENKQYERASAMYERLLYSFDYDLDAGLEYAEMELEERLNYSKAEDIVRRFVLDHHINSPEGILLLGDIYLEWATNRDPSKFEDARLQYANLIQLYGQKPLYLSRMMRYFIRTDNLKEVLPLKDYFYPKIKKDILEPCDLVELSGYMLDKLYGELPAKEEYLRSSIEDVRDLLEQAVNKAPDIPEAMYNYGRYFIETGSRVNAQVVLEEALIKFENAEKKTEKRLISQIDTYRLLGELSCEDLDYLKAEKYYVDGITLFENEHDNSGLKSDPKIGLLYADLADIDYFISGNFEAALSNYMSAIENYNDTPSIRYRVGYIQYSNENYSEALGSFIKAVNEKPSDKYLLLALGNTLTLRNSTSAAQGYYEKLISLLDLERHQSGILFPQSNSMDGDLVELYMKASNNLGVVLSLRSNQTGDGNLLPKAMANFEESIRAFDSLTRNQETMIRVDGSNLASYNQKYLTYSYSDFEPSIYTEIYPVMEGEKIPEKSVVK